MSRFLAARAVPCAVVAVAASVAAGQAMNIDFWNGAGTPSDTYGAAGGQPGRWNAIGHITMTTPAPLVDLNGAATGATIRTFSGDSLVGTLIDTGPTGDDRALLMDGLLATDLAVMVHLEGLTPGAYTLVVYAWPGNSTPFTVIRIGGVEGFRDVGGAWSGSLQPGITHTSFDIALSGPTLDVTFNGPFSGYGVLSGLQLVPVPGPDAWAVIGVGIAFVSGRRTRR